MALMGGCQLDPPLTQSYISVCGNGVVEPGEDCDEEESDYCDRDCSFAKCGDGLLNTRAGEACDDGFESAECNDDCSLSACGDGILNVAAGEECEGTDIEGMTCQDRGFDGGTLECGEDCTFDTSSCGDVPGIPTAEVHASAIKQFEFDWSPVPGADCYEVLQGAAPDEEFVSLNGECVVDGPVSYRMPLHLSHQAWFRVRARSPFDHRDSLEMPAPRALEDAVGYVKASTPDPHDRFGYSLALSTDGRTLAVGAPYEDNAADNVDGNESDNHAEDAGAVYIFRQFGTEWFKQAYLKAQSVAPRDEFGFSVALSGDGNVLAVGVPRKDVDVVGGTSKDDKLVDSGVVYIYERTLVQEYEQWSPAGGLAVPLPDQDNEREFGWSVSLDDDGDTLVVGSPGVVFSEGRAYVYSRGQGRDWERMRSFAPEEPEEPLDPTPPYRFGHSVALSGDGSTIAIGAPLEGGPDGMSDCGAVYVSTRSDSPVDSWSTPEVLTATEPSARDYFGTSVALNQDGSVLAVGAPEDDGDATDSAGDLPNSGAVYVYTRDNRRTWSDPTRFKAPNAGEDDRFGQDLALSDDGTILTVGAHRESSDATGIEGVQVNDDADQAGAVYVFVRDMPVHWTHHACVKASNTDAGDWFGRAVALSGDGETLAVGAPREDSQADQIDGEQADNASQDAGAVYLY